MSIVKDILREEKERLQNLCDKYERELLALPKGSLSKKQRGNQWYYYIAFREGSNVQFRYIGKEGSKQVQEMREKILQRRKIEKQLKEIKQNMREIEKGLDGK